MNPDSLCEKAQFMVDVCRKLIDIIAQIETSNNKEEIEMLIDSAQFLDDKMSSIENLPPSNIKASIKIGQGDYGKIQQKCVQLGIV